MDRRTEELLLSTLRLLERRPLSEEDVVRDLGRLGSESRSSDVLVGLAALEAEALVEAETLRGRTVYGITDEGIDAVRRRADPVGTERVGSVGAAAGAPEPGATHQLRRVAILFTDIVGSTELLDRLGDLTAHGLRRRHFELLRRAVREHAGREVKNLGDGLMVVFASAEAAVACALAMQLAVETGEDPLELRIGIAWGETVCEDDDYFGRPVILARRLCDSARGGDVIVPRELAGLLPDPAAAELTQLRPLALKGLSKPVTASAMRLRALELAA